MRCRFARVGSRSPHRELAVTLLAVLGTAWSVTEAQQGAGGDCSRSITRVETELGAVAVAVDDAHAYVGVYSGLNVIDVSSPTAASLQADFGSDPLTTSVAVAGSYAYVAAAEFGLRVIDITDPAALARVGGVPTPGDALGVAVTASHAYLADSDAVRVIDISNPAAPVLVGTVATPAGGVALAGTHAYVAGGHAGLQVLDITNPTAPFLAGSIDPPDVALGVTVAGSYAYVAARYAGLQVIDISDPAAPVLVGSVDTPGQAMGVTVAGSYAYVADLASGLQVIDVSDPRAPALVCTVDTPGEATGVAVAGSYAYVADGSSLQVIDISNFVRGLRFALGVRPFPARESAVFALSMPSSEAVRLEVFDVAGRRVRVLLDEVRGPGEHLITWDGRNGAGQRVANGMYFVRFAWPGGSRRTRAAFAR